MFCKSVSIFKSRMNTYFSKTAFQYELMAGITSYGELSVIEYSAFTSTEFVPSAEKYEVQFMCQNG